MSTMQNDVEFVLFSHWSIRCFGAPIPDTEYSSFIATSSFRVNSIYSKSKKNQYLKQLPLSWTLMLNI